MNTYCCEPKSCNKKGTCNHHISNPIYCRRIREDLSDICLPDFRLYFEDKHPRRFKSKKYYIELFSFYDNNCCGQECDNRKPYTDIKANFATQIDCKLGKNYTCCLPKHPDNIAINRAFSVIEAEEEAFEKAGIKEGTVTYTCPICGGDLVSKHSAQVTERTVTDLEVR